MKYAKAFIHSFYSARFYWALARVWSGIGSSLVFLLSLVMVTGMAIMAGMGLLFSDNIENFMHKAPEFVQTLPAIQITNGTLSMDRPSPFTIKPDNDPLGSRIIIDTTYQAPGPDQLENYMRTNRIPVILTATDMITLNQDKLEIYSFKRVNSFSITHANWEKAGNISKEWGVTMIFIFTLIVLFLCMLPMLFLVNTLLSFFCAIIVKLLSLILEVNLSFAACMRMASGLRIPTTILGYVFTIIPTSAIVSWLIWAGYVAFSVWSVKRGDQSV